MMRLPLPAPHAAHPRRRCLGCSAQATLVAVVMVMMMGLGVVLAGPQVETGTLTFSQGQVNAWKTVPLTGPFQNPVVITSPVSYCGGQPAMVRLRNVTATSFQIKIDEWRYLDRLHTTETICYVVMDAGCHVLSNGLTIEAGTLQANHGWRKAAFAASFPTAPIVVTQSQTYAGDDPIVTRQRLISAAGFEVRVQEEEALGPHANETIGYLAASAGIYELGEGILEVAGAGAFDHRWGTAGFAGDFRRAPVLLAAMQTCAGGDPAALRYSNLTAGGARIVVQEEQSRDQETAHIKEGVGFMAWETAGVVDLEPERSRGGESANLLVNGGFEQHVVSGTWNIFRTIPGWVLVSGPSFELQRGICGGPAEGKQHLEMDADVNGPGGGPMANEQGGVTISQSVDTVPGQLYRLRFAFAGRPGTRPDENIIGLEVAGVPKGKSPTPIDTSLTDAEGAPVVGDLNLPGGSGWRYFTTTFEATDECTAVSFAYRGKYNNTLGALLDDVSLVALDSPRGIEGSIEINPNNSRDNEFAANLPDGSRVAREDLHEETVTAEDGTYYEGPATEFWIKPQGNGKQGSLVVGGVPFDLQNQALYYVAGEDLLIRIWNDKRQKSGRALGHWWIDVSTPLGTIREILGE